MESYLIRLKFLVISDKIVPVNSGTTTIGYMPIIASITDYYSFGSEIFERTYSHNVYRFGFNGKEDLHEQRWYQDYGARFYNKALGRFVSADPLIVKERKYPFYSSYQFAGLNPIKYIDMDGLEPKNPGKEIGEIQSAPQQTSCKNCSPEQKWMWTGNEWGYALDEINIKPAEIKFSKNANPNVISGKTKGILRFVMRQTDIPEILITSTMRTPERQAEIMYANLEFYGISSQKELYMDAGDKVIDVYNQGKIKKLNKDEIIANMIKKIYELGPQNVSKHVGDPSKINVLDIDPYSIGSEYKRINFNNILKKTPEIKKILSPYTKPEDPAFHIEIPQ